MRRGGDSEAKKIAKEYIDSALAERRKLGYGARISKKSYGAAVERAAGVFEEFQRANREGTARPPC